jgi:hypothetical protein
MALPFTVEQFLGVFRDYNIGVWPAQWFLVAMALMAVAAVLRPRPWSGVAVSAILGLLRAWIAVAYHVAFFARINAAAHAFAALSIAGAAVFIRQGVIQRRLTLRWAPGPGATAGGALIVFALLATAGRQLRTHEP